MLLGLASRTTVPYHNFYNLSQTLFEKIFIYSLLLPPFNHFYNSKCSRCPWFLEALYTAVTFESCAKTWAERPILTLFAGFTKYTLKPIFKAIVILFLSAKRRVIPMGIRWTRLSRGKPNSRRKIRMWNLLRASTFTYPVFYHWRTYSKVCMFHLKTVRMQYFNLNILN